MLFGAREGLDVGTLVGRLVGRIVGREGEELGLVVGFLERGFNVGV